MRGMRQYFLGLAIFALGCVAVHTPVSAHRIAEASSELQIVSHSFWLQNNSQAQFTFVLPPSVAISRNVLVDVNVHRRVSTRSAFRTLAAEEAQAAIIDTFTQSITNASATANGAYRVTVPITSTIDSTRSLRIPFDGVYPVSLVLRSTQNTESLARTLTFVHHTSTNTQPVWSALAVAVRLAPSISMTPDGTVVISDKTRADIEEFIAYLSEFPSPISVSIQPEVIAALATSPDPRDGTLLTQLKSQLASRSIAMTAFVALDPSMFAAIDRGEEFIEQVRFGESVLNKYLSGVRLQRGTWWATHPLSADGVALLRTAGIVSVVLLPAAQRETTSTAPLTVLSKPDGKDNQFMSVVSVDAGIAQTLTQGSHSASAYRAVAEVLMEHEDRKAAGLDMSSLRIVVSTPTATIDNAGALRIATRLLSARQLRDASTPDTVTTSTPSMSFPAATQHGGLQRAAGIAVARRELTATQSMTADADPRRDVWASLLALGESTGVTEPNEYIAGLRTQLTATRGAISVTTPGSITLSDRKSVIRFQLRNDSTNPLSVRVRLSSAKLTLANPVQVVTLAAGSTTEVKVDAETRTNGRFPITVRITTPDNALEVVPYITITARVNAIAGLGQLLSISLLLIILAWWWSHWRRSRTTAADATTVSDQ